MANTTYTPTGAIKSTDYHAVKWVGLTKGGKSVTINFTKAINLGNIDWTFVEKDDTVASITFTSVYANTDEMATTTTEAFTIEVEDGITAGASEIMLGAGLLYIDNNKVALTRGGGSFNVEREFRRINADGDRGAVEGRIVMEGSEATLTVNSLQILTKLTSLYPAMN